MQGYPCCNTCRRVTPGRYQVCPGLAECKTFQDYHNGLTGQRTIKELTALNKANEAIRGD